MVVLGHGADGQLGVGKEVWLFHGKLTSGVQSETVNVLCYSNGRAEHLEVCCFPFFVILLDSSQLLIGSH